jgi:hypothetical protein
MVFYDIIKVLFVANRRRQTIKSITVGLPSKTHLSITQVEPHPLLELLLTVPAALSQ